MAASKTFDEYADALKSLLAGAEAAAAAGDRAEMEAAREGLEAFVEDSDDTVDGVLELDEVASKARRDVVLSLLRGAMVDDLAARTPEVSALIKKFAGAAEVNDSKAAAIRLERIRKVTGAAITLVDELKKFSDLNDDSSADGRRLAAALKTAIDAVQNLQKKLV